MEFDAYRDFRRQFVHRTLDRPGLLSSGRFGADLRWREAVMA
jgi:hypothetical protein